MKIAQIEVMLFTKRTALIFVFCLTLGGANSIRALPIDVVVIGIVSIAYIKEWYTKRADVQRLALEEAVAIRVHEKMLKMQEWLESSRREQRTVVKHPTLNYNESIHQVEHLAVDYNEPLSNEDND